MDLVVVERAHREPVGQAGGSAAGVPAHVVDLAPGRSRRAAGPLAVPVPGQDRSAQLLGVRPLRLPDVQRDPVGVQHEAGDLAVAHQPLQLRGRYDGPVVQLGQRHRSHRHRPGPDHLTDAHRGGAVVVAAPGPFALRRRGRAAARRVRAGAGAAGGPGVRSGLLPALDAGPGLGGDQEGEVGPDLGAETVVPDLQDPLTQAGQRVGATLVRGPLIPG